MVILEHPFQIWARDTHQAITVASFLKEKGSLFSITELLKDSSNWSDKGKAAMKQYIHERQQQLLKIWKEE